jgi:anti-sigma factor RsiW
MLSAYLDGELPSREKARVEKHLQECAACAEGLRTLRWTVGLMKEIPSVPVPHPFTVPAPIPERRLVFPRPGRAYTFLRGATALAAVLLMLVLSGDRLSQRLLRGPVVAPAPAGVSSPQVLEMPQAEALPSAEGEETEKVLTQSAGAAPTPLEAADAAERAALPRPSETTAWSQEPPPVGEPPFPLRPGSDLLRQIEWVLLAATIILAMTTAIMGRRRRG